jgi:hypothetical protein
MHEDTHSTRNKAKEQHPLHARVAADPIKYFDTAPLGWTWTSRSSDVRPEDSESVRAKIMVKADRVE